MLIPHGSDLLRPGKRKTWVVRFQCLSHRKGPPVARLTPINLAVNSASIGLSALRILSLIPCKAWCSTHTASPFQVAHGNSSFHYFQPSKKALGPRTTVRPRIPEASQVLSGRGHCGALGHPRDFSLPLRFPGTMAGPVHGVPALLWWTACIPAASMPVRGMLARGWGHVCCCKNDFDLLPFSGRSKVVGRTEEITEHVSTQSYHLPPGNPPNMGEALLCQKAQPAVFPKGSLGLQLSMHNKEHLLACSAFY